VRTFKEKAGRGLRLVGLVALARPIGFRHGYSRCARSEFGQRSLLGGRSHRIRRLFSHRFLLYRRFLDGAALVISIRHALSDEGFAFGAREFLVVGAEFAGFHLLRLGERGGRRGQ
jgi:hypothetical protein